MNLDHRDLLTVDLNLLVVFDAICEHGGVSAAATALGRSQSAVSHALGRLREQIGDPLFVRVGQGVEPTSRAEEMRAPVSRLLGEMGAILLEEPVFDPATSRREVTIVSADYTQHLVLTTLAAQLRQVAPGLDLHVRKPSVEESRRVAVGEIDMGFSVTVPEVANLKIRTLFEDRFVCVFYDPDGEVELDLEGWLARPHLLVMPQGVPGSFVDNLLAQQGRSRRVAVRTPFFLGVPEIIAGSDLVTSMPARLAARLVDHPGLRVVEAPVEMAPFAVHLVWHERLHRDPAHRWMRERIVDVCDTLPSI